MFCGRRYACEVPVLRPSPQPTHPHSSQASRKTSTISNERPLSGVERAVATVAKWPDADGRKISRYRSLWGKRMTNLAGLKFHARKGGGNPEGLVDSLTFCATIVRSLDLNRAWPRFLNILPHPHECPFHIARYKYSSH
jgi:hypothetical protein